MSKAWVAYNFAEDAAIVVFADTEGKARSYLMLTEIFDRYSFIDIVFCRAKDLDYLNRPDGYVMDWNNDDDRLPMVRDAGLRCRLACKEMCEECCAKEWCREYECLKEEENYNE